ncbi:MAG: carboxymuconolactone decarboxylase family protein [bacterium]|nr:carboxymuconolactone decarboxylase family protein [bacterium]MCP5069161.1 carboxymuconolactone decarboxylase family protein [bacterium]
MRLDTPRVPPLDPSEMDEKLRERFGDRPILNIFRTLAQHPDLMRRWLVFGNHVLAKSTLPARERELVILRIGYLCRAGYEWGQHVEIGKQSGLTDDEITAIAEGPGAGGWSELDRALLQATDELHGDAFIGDATWQTLSKHLDTQQLMDLVFSVGQYNLVSMALNTLGVQPEPGLAKLPDA